MNFPHRVTIACAAIALAAFGCAALAQNRAKPSSSVTFGSVSGLADRARYELREGRITYSGNVEIRTDRGDVVTADRIVLTLNKARTDVQTVEASGGVKATVTQSVAATPGHSAFVRKISAQANSANLDVAARTLLLQGNVSGRSEEPDFVATFRGAKVDVNLTTGIIDAEGSAANRAQVTYTKKTTGNG
jgi:lipopolysaccharide export system protein LptA